MNSGLDWRIPSSVIHGITALPEDRPIALLIRHSVRDELPSGAAGNELPITAAGKQLACELGSLIGLRLRSLHTSPLARCVQTAKALSQGSEVNCPVVFDKCLGDPGVFVRDGQQAQLNWDLLGNKGVVRHLISSDDILSGMSEPGVAACSLVHHMFTVADNVPGLHIFVTHDSLVLVTVARILKQQLGDDSWPWFLEGGFFWREQNNLHIHYRDQYQIRDAWF